MGKMNGFSIWALAGRKANDVLHAPILRYSIKERIRIGWSGQLWSRIAGPFHRSIYVRFQYVFGLAVAGLTLMAAITLISGGILLNTFETSVSEASSDLIALHRIQESLRQTEHLTYLYAIEGDQSAPLQFKEHQETANLHFRQLAENELESEAPEHAQFHLSLPETIRAWQDAQSAVLKVFQQTPGTPGATETLVRANGAINPVYNVISEFHLFSLHDLEERLRFAKSVAGWAHAAVFGGILAGLGILLVVGLVVGRSVLQPIGGLQEAARKLGRKDFSHRVRLRNTKDELGQLGKAFNIASATLQRSFLELKRRSTHDGLTGAINRGEFEQRLLAECISADRRKRPLALLMVDVDFFKCINDNHGHQAGDRVLQAVARLLSETMRTGDLVARYGGEEFAIILPETDEKQAVAAADSLRRTIEKSSINCAPGVDIHLTVSIGCAGRPPLAMTPADLVKAADMALYRAKRTGRNRVVSAKKLPVKGGARRQVEA
jgi:diguanylate cyclase (GGDEF)-like protein